MPGDIPASIDVDVTGMKVGDVIRVADLPHGGKFKFITDEDAPVANLSIVKEDEAVAELDAALAAATSTEPEVLKKGKGEAEGDAAKGDKK